ncbi:GD17266 [Drosophila simulans]|uniref:GD17266 n=1 Tax=Drosophila simulans TaxID=7240 RepID=B4R5R4_DROSI|nr:GD17266 [Drosophila simulans]
MFTSSSAGQDNTLLPTPGSLDSESCLLRPQLGRGFWCSGVWGSWSLGQTGRVAGFRQSATICFPVIIAIPGAWATEKKMKSALKRFMDTPATRSDNQDLDKKTIRPAN